MHAIKSLGLILIMSVSVVAAGQSPRPLNLNERFKSNQTTIAGALALAGLTNFKSQQLSNMMVEVFQNHRLMKCSML